MFLVALGIVIVFTPRAVALLTGGVGNRPLNNPGWPKGAAAIFNVPARVAFWEGPPFGGGQWHAECRGDAKAFNAVLADFAKLDVKTKRLVVHDGVGHSFWLNPNREPGKEVDSRVDWVFMVWVQASWEQLSRMPVDFNSVGPVDLEKGPPSEIDVFAGGNLRWADVVVPKGIEVADHRLEAHGFSAADGVVIEGKIVDLVTKQAVAGRMMLARVETPKTGGYRYVPVSETAADARGRWVLKNVPAGWHRVVVDADGFVPRVAGYIQTDGQPLWQSYESGLSPPGPVTGRVIDDAGKPVPDADVRLDHMKAKDGSRYQSSEEYRSKTDADGRFRLDRIPTGTASVWVHKPGYIGPGLGMPITTPSEGVAVPVKQSAQVRVTVTFEGVKRPEGYMVRIVPEGGEAVGKWSGSGNVNAQNQMEFKDVPPGKYVVTGRPNPGSPDEETKPLTVVLEGGKLAEFSLFAR